MKCNCGEGQVNDYRKLENQPLKFVLSEFRFSPVMQIRDFIPRVQELLRKKYPLQNKKMQQSFQVQSDGLTVTQIESWSFISKEKKNAIEINQDRLIFYTSEYPRFEGFSDECKEALSVLSEIVDPTLILRIGLRYGDLIVVDEGESISKLVDKQFGLAECISDIGELSIQNTETIIKTGIGTLLIRSMYGEHNLTCMPDIQGLPINIGPDKNINERLILDFDNFWEAGEDAENFEVERILEKLDSLHESSRLAFWNITTDYARNEKWS